MARFVRVLVSLLVAVLTASLAALALSTAPAGAAPTVENREPPTISGKVQFDQRLTVSVGRWDPEPVAATYQWLRAGRAITGANSMDYRPVLKDLGKRLSVRVEVADAEGDTGAATSAQTTPVKRSKLKNKTRPSVSGEQRFTETVRATPGRWSPGPTRTSYQWLRSGKPIKGATKERYTFAPGDVNKRIRVRVTVKAPGYRHMSRSSAKTDRVAHRVPQRRVATYSIATRGRITASVKKFARQAAQTFSDARGWRGGGTTFRRVKSGGGFTLVLSEAGQVPSFSSQCSSYYSCRVGRFVIINQDRWKFASPPWNAAGRSLRDYRHLVVNHEVGHWLGNGHAGCRGGGQLAPVMGQQSKGTGGCRFNPWPRPYEY